MAQREQRRSLLAGSDGFQRIPDAGGNGMNDATINIPLDNTGPGNGQKSINNEKTAHFRQPGKTRTNSTHGSEGDALTTMGKVYNAILNFSLVTRYLLYVLPLGTLIAVPVVLGATVFQNEQAGGVPIVWVFTWVEVVWVSLWGSKIFAKLLPRIFQFLAGIVSPGVRKYSLAIQNLEVPITLLGWAVTSLATFIPILQSHPSPHNFGFKEADGNNPAVEGGPFAWENDMNNVLAALVFCAGLFLLEKAFVQLISINYHSNQYHARIKDNKKQVHLIGVLYEASRALFEPFCPEFADEDYIIHNALELPVHGGQKSAIHAANPLRLLQNVGRFGDQITSAFGRVAHEVSGKEVFNPTASHSIVVEALERKVSSEALARRIWMSLVVEGKDALYQEDVVEVLSDRPKEDAIEAFNAVDRDGNGDVSLDEMILTVCEIARERKAVASSLHNIDQAIGVLDKLLLVLVAVGCVFIFVAFLNSSFNTTLATAGTALLSLSFVFSATAAEILNSCIFLFVKHPYDVDDRVDINSTRLVVERISLMYTVFRNVENHKTTQVANSVLNALWIDNVTRSKAMREQLQMYISFDTTLEDIELLRREMQAFVLDKENSRDFEPEISVEVTGINKMDQMELLVEIRHKSNWSNETVRAARRSKFMCALVLALRKVPINGPGGGGAALGSADAPAYSVTVSDEKAAAARKAFAAAQDAKRLKPNNKADSSSKTESGIGYSTTTDLNAPPPRNRNRPLADAEETSAMMSLNLRSPTYDPSRDLGNDSSYTSMNAQGLPLSPSRSHISTISEEQGASGETGQGVLRRQSTRGKRRAEATAPRNGSAAPAYETISIAHQDSYGTYLGPQNVPNVQQTYDAPAPQYPARTQSPPRQAYSSGAPNFAPPTQSSSRGGNTINSLNPLGGNPNGQLSARPQHGQGSRYDYQPLTANSTRRTSMASEDPVPAPAPLVPNSRKSPSPPPAFHGSSSAQGERAELDGWVEDQR